MQALSLTQPLSQQSGHYDEAAMGRPAIVERSAVGSRIAAARVAAGLTQEQLAQKIDVSLPNIAFWERRAPSPRTEMLAKIADALGVSIDDLLGRAQPRKKTGGPVGKVRQVFEEVSKLPRHHQQRIIGVVEALVAQSDGHKQAA